MHIKRGADMLTLVRLEPPPEDDSPQWKPWHDTVLATCQRVIDTGDDLCIDVQNIRSPSSLLLGLFSRIQAQAGRDIGVSGLNAHWREVLRITHMDRLLTIREPYETSNGRIVVMGHGAASGEE